MKDTKAARVLALEGHKRHIHGRVQEEATLPVSDSATSSARAESSIWKHGRMSQGTWDLLYCEFTLGFSHKPRLDFGRCLYIPNTKAGFRGEFLWVFVVLDVKRAWNWSSGKACLLIKETWDVCFIKKWIDGDDHSCSSTASTLNTPSYNQLLPIPCFLSHISSPDPSLLLPCCMYMQAFTWLQNLGPACDRTRALFFSWRPRFFNDYLHSFPFPCKQRNYILLHGWRKVDCAYTLSFLYSFFC